ncbi:MAG: hypothetical protein FRX49_07990 [Trebouxia sp. A1-2]|nr:MAG: hypothetical protein FRX49_07990 [Trebouxia sp. A1-2]
MPNKSTTYYKDALSAWDSQVPTKLEVIFSSCFFLLSFFILRMHIVDNVSYPESDADFSIPVLLAALGPASRQDTPTLGWPPLSWDDVTAGGSERSGVDSNAKLRTLHRLIDHNAMDASRVLTSLMGTKDKAPSSLLNSLLLNMIAIWRCKIWVYDTNLGT